MRSLTLAALCLALASPAAAEDKKPTPAAAAPAAPTLSPADTDRALRAIGLSIARSLEPYTLSAAELDKIVAAIREGAGPKGTRPDEKAPTDIRALLQARQAAEAEKEKSRGATLLASAEKEKGAVKTANGAIVIPLKAGTGATPAATDKVKVNYTGTLVDGKVFDATKLHVPPGPMEFPLNGVIPCWTEALQKMKVGGRAKVVCAPGIAYGEHGYPPSIPGNAALTFDIELLEIVKEAAPAGK
jgi:FKBP-type peptidyl-prolyl cis-trans isomerase